MDISLLKKLQTNVGIKDILYILIFLGIKLK